MVGWLVRKLGGAVVAGVGWKLGADAYDAVKRRLQGPQQGTETKDKDSAAAAAEAETASAVDNSASPPGSPAAGTMK